MHKNFALVVGSLAVVVCSNALLGCNGQVIDSVADMVSSTTTGDMADGSVDSPPPPSKVCSGRFVIDAKMETVYDRDSKLTWQRTDSYQEDGLAYTLAQARAYCRNLPLAGGGWHLPTEAEAKTIIEPEDTGKGCHLNQCAFKCVGVYWTADLSSMEAHGRALEPGAGRITDYGVLNTLYIKCVR